MKKLLIVFVASLGIMSCTGNKTNTEKGVDSTVIDSDTVVVDTVIPTISPLCDSLLKEKGL